MSGSGLKHKDDFSDAARYAQAILKKAGVGDRLPTPVDDIVACADLVVSGDVDLSPRHFAAIAKSKNLLLSILAKVRGLVDLRENVILLDPNCTAGKKNFVKLHEVGHKVLPWQQQSLLYIDDDVTLDPETKERYEREASFFASEVLFQGGRFDREARDLPLEINSAIHLSRRYGSSIHAALRRFVRTNHRACALIVVEQEDPQRAGLTARLHVRNTELSQRFIKTVGAVDWPEYLPESFPATPLIRAGRRWCKDEIVHFRYRDGSKKECRFQLFDNRHNTVFIFIVPSDERTATRTRFVVQ